MPELAKEKLDLSSWRACINGGEAVRTSTIERFNQSFASCGLSSTVIKPGYGLAECTLTVSSTGGEKDTRAVWLDADASERGRVVLRDDGIRGSGARGFQSCGWTWIDADIQIVDPLTLEACPADKIGEIWVKSTNVALGYWRNPEASNSTMHARMAGGEGPYLRTGDLGFILDKQLYLAGRLKDLIVIHGRNIYPHDIEATLEAAHSAVRLGRCCAFSIEVDEGEALVVVAEVERTERHAFDSKAVFGAIREAISLNHEVQLHDAVFIRTGTFPLTSSGKVQRQAARHAYLNGALHALFRMLQVDQPARTVAEDPLQRDTAILREWLLAFVAGKLKVAATQIRTDCNFEALGLDSLALFEMTGELEEQLERTLPATLALDYPNIGQLSSHLASAGISARLQQYVRPVLGGISV